jgi:hypothetical protein
MNVSSGIGILVLYALDCIKDGLDIHQIAEVLREKASKIKTIFIIDTLEFVRKGGRCTALESFIGDILKIRPVLGVIDGKLNVIEKTRGSRKKALSELLRKVENDKDNIDPKRIMIAHAMGHDDAHYLKTEIEKMIDVEQVIISETGCSVSSHCGPNTVGIIYLLKYTYLIIKMRSYIKLLPHLYYLFSFSLEVDFGVPPVLIPSFSRISINLKIWLWSSSLYLHSILLVYIIMVAYCSRDSSL